MQFAIFVTLLYKAAILHILSRIYYGSLRIYQHPNGVQHSTKFHVHLHHFGHPRQSSFTYMSTSDHRATEDNRVTPSRSVSWTSFAFTGSPVTVQIISSKDFHTCVVRPMHYGFQCNRTAPYTAEVVITENTRMISVEFDFYFGTPGNSDIIDKLLIFADAPEHDIPADRKVSNVLFYGQGVHDLGGLKLIHRNITEVYIAPGAYVHGAFKTESNYRGVKIHGRGILSGERYAYKDPELSWALIFFDKGEHHTVEGLVLVDPFHFYVRGLGCNNVVRNIKTLAAWIYNSDGVALGPNGTVEDSFIMANDDALKIYRDNLTISRCVIWQRQNGAVFQFGWWPNRDLHHVIVSDIDIIHTDWCAFKGEKCTIAHNHAVFVLRNVTKLFNVEDLEFRNIRIEGICPRLFNFRVPPNSTGSISDFRFVNWTVEADSPYGHLSNSIYGTSDVPLTDWQFVNFKINSRCITNTHGADIKTDNTTSLNFQCDDH